MSTVIDHDVDDCEREDVALDRATIGRSQIVDEIGVPLLPAVRGERTSPSPQAQADIHALFVRCPHEFILQLVVTWAMVVSAIVLSVHIDSWWVSLATIIFIATRQNVLGLLMHEQCHRLAFHSKNGDLLCNLFAAYPLLVTLDGYRRVHLAHHQNYFTEHDPDYLRKQGKDWTFPQRVTHFAVSVLKDLSGLSTLQTIRGKGMEDPQAGKLGKRRSWFVRVAFYAAVVGTVAMFNGWSVVALYWFVPLFTVLQLIVRWGAICEHKYNLVHPTVAESTPIIIPHWWERLLLPNLNFTFHIYHHWYPRVPFIHLTDVHAIFCREGLVEKENVFHGYSSYLRYLFTGNVRSTD